MAIDFPDVQFDQKSNVAPTQKQQRLELAVFLLLVVPSLVLSLFAIRQGSLTFPITAAAVILRDLGLISLIWFFLWRNGEALSDIGWTMRHVGRELSLGAALFIPFTLVTGLVEWALLQAGLSAPATPLPSMLKVQGGGEALLALVLVAVVAVAEETIFRGYLLLRFGTLLRSSTAAVLVSSAIFSVGHGYEGSAGLATVGVMGIILAGVYLWRGSLAAPIMMHFLQDFFSIVLLPFLNVR